jgi:hypothetical protein
VTSEIPDFPSRDDLTRLSRWAGVQIEDLAALSPDRDPFLQGTPAHTRDAAEFVRLTAGVNLDVHLRGLYYRLLSLDSTGFDGNWKWLQKAAARARDLGLVDPWAFPDKRTRALLSDGRGDGEVEYEITKPTLFGPHVALLARYACVKNFSALEAQPVRVLGLIEKDDDDIRAEIVPSFREAGAELRVTTGFSPKTLAARLAQEALRDPRPLVVFLITDADSSGEAMAVATGRHLEFLSKQYDLPPIYLARIALTLAQVKEIEAEIGRPIPLAPDVAREIGRVELNALPVFAPGWLRRQTEKALASVTVEIAEPDVEVPYELDDALVRAQRLMNRLYRRIGDKLDRIDRIISDALEEWEPEEPEVEIPEPDLDHDWILDTGRDYLEQLNAYRRHGPAHRDTNPLVLRERVCACGCGRSLAHMAVQARYYEAACRARARRAR